MEKKKQFTLEEANSLLPLINEELSQLQEIKRRFESAFQRWKQLKEAGAGSEKLPADSAFAKAGNAEEVLFELEFEMEFMQIEARTLIQSMNMKGALLKDLDLGLVDFPSVIDGEEVLLCWRQGEESITHYHGINEGYYARKPIRD